jgi:hypothetical protein
MTTAKLWRNRKERKDWARRLRSEDPGLEVVHPHAAGIDVPSSIPAMFGQTSPRDKHRWHRAAIRRVSKQRRTPSRYWQLVR